jgi:hypothetical protein
VDYSKDAVIANAAGEIEYNAFQQDGIIGRFTARYAFAVPNPINRMNTDEGTRYPFAVLRDTA